MNISGRIEHQVSSEIDAGSVHTGELPTFLSVLRAWEELGYIELTEAGKALFGKKQVKLLPAPER